MAYNEGVADRIRSVLALRTDTREQKMFGGIAFMIGGNMAVGVMGDELLVRAGKEDGARFLAQSDVRTMEMGGRSSTGWLLIGGQRLEDEFELWVDRGVSYAQSLPAKK